MILSSDELKIVDLVAKLKTRFEARYGGPPGRITASEKAMKLMESAELTAPSDGGGTAVFGVPVTVVGRKIAPGLVVMTGKQHQHVRTSLPVRRRRRRRTTCIKGRTASQSGHPDPSSAAWDVLKSTVDRFKQKYSVLPDKAWMSVRTLDRLLSWDMITVSPLKGRLVCGVPVRTRKGTAMPDVVTFTGRKRQLVKTTLRAGGLKPSTVREGLEHLSSLLDTISAKTAKTAPETTSSAAALTRESLMEFKKAFMTTYGVPPEIMEIGKGQFEKELRPLWTRQMAVKDSCPIKGPIGLMGMRIRIYDKPGVELTLCAGVGDSERRLTYGAAEITPVEDCCSKDVQDRLADVVKRDSYEVYMDTPVLVGDDIRMCRRDILDGWRKYDSKWLDGILKDIGGQLPIKYLKQVKNDA